MTALPKVRRLLGLDRVIHEPARLAILSILSSAEAVDFKFLEQATGLTKGNLGSHMSKLEEAGYVRVHKAFRGKQPVTSYSLTARGRSAYESYVPTLFAGLTRR